MTFRLFLPVLLIWVFWPGAEAAAQCAVGSVQFENDIGLGGTDRHYTHGTRGSCISDNQKKDTTARDLAGALRFEIAGYPVLDSGGEVRYSFGVGQTMYTPEDLTRTDLIEDDRPYAGWLFASYGLVLGPRLEQKFGSTAFDRMETLQLTLGIVGEESGADRTQKFVHSVIDAEKPRGWRNQLETEPGFILEYEQKWRTERHNLFGSRFEVDVMPSAGFALGNIHTYGAAAATFRIGTRLANDFGPPRIRPSIAGSEYYEPNPGERLSAYWFFSIGGRAVARNIFLDGNTFRSSHDVDRKVWVGDIQVGSVVSLWGRARLSFTHILRSREFDEQDTFDQFSAFSLSFRF